MTERARTHTYTHTHTHTHTHTQSAYGVTNMTGSLWALESFLVTERVGLEQAVLVFLPGPGGGATKEKRGFQLKGKVVLIFVSCFFLNHPTK